MTPGTSGTMDALVTPTTATLTDGRTLEADIYIPAVGTRPNRGSIAESLFCSDGRVDNDRSTLRVEKAGPPVYAIGDAAYYAWPAAHAIMNAVPVLCTNIKRNLLLAPGQKDTVGVDCEFQEDSRETQMVPIGQGKGVGAAMGYQLPSWMVWLIKGQGSKLLVVDHWKTVERGAVGQRVVDKWAEMLRAS